MWHNYIWHLYLFWDNTPSFGNIIALWNNLYNIPVATPTYDHVYPWPRLPMATPMHGKPLPMAFHTHYHPYPRSPLHKATPTHGHPYPRPPLPMVTSTYAQPYQWPSLNYKILTKCIFDCLILPICSNYYHSVQPCHIPASHVLNSNTLLGQRMNELTSKSFLCCSAVFTE